MSCGNKMLRFLEVDLTKFNNIKPDDLDQLLEQNDIAEESLFPEFVPLDISLSGPDGELKKLSPQFQQAIKLTKEDKREEITPRAAHVDAVNFARDFKGEKINIRVPEGLLKKSEATSEDTTKPTPILLSEFNLPHLNKKPVPPAQIKEAALLKCASWMDSNKQFVARPVSSRVRAAWKKEKNVVIASTRVRSSRF